MQIKLKTTVIKVLIIDRLILSFGAIFYVDLLNILKTKNSTTVNSKVEIDRKKP